MESEELHGTTTAGEVLVDDATMRQMRAARAPAAAPSPKERDYTPLRRYVMGFVAGLRVEPGCFRFASTTVPDPDVEPPARRPTAAPLSATKPPVRGGRRVDSRRLKKAR